MVNPSDYSHQYKTRDRNMDPISAGTAVAGGAFNILQGHLDRKAARENMATQNQYNEDAAALEWQRNLEQWYRQNEYNNPAQQMARLKAAGINPHMAYAKGTINNISGQNPKYQASRMDNPSIPAPQLPNIGLYQDARLKKVQTDNVQQATVNAATKNSMDLLRMPGITEDNKRKIRDNAINAQYQAEAARLSNERKTSEITLLGKKAEYQDELNRMAKLNLAPASNQWVSLLENLVRLFKEQLAPDEELPEGWMDMSDMEKYKYMEAQQYR